MTGCGLAFVAGTLLVLRAAAVPGSEGLLALAVLAGLSSLSLRWPLRGSRARFGRHQTASLAAARADPVDPAGTDRAIAPGDPVATVRMRLRRWRCQRLRSQTGIACLWLAFGLLGAANAAWHARAVVDARLPEAYVGRTVVVEAEVVGLPQRLPEGWRLRLLVSLPDLPGTRSVRVRCEDAVFAPTGRAPRAGEHWRLTLRLRPPRGLANPGLFDYEAWLAANRIAAMGYCRGPAEHLAAAPAAGPLAWRARIAAALDTASGPPVGLALTRALAIGDETAIDAPAREVLIATGTVHLISVSGLHISLVGLGTAALIRWGLGAIPLATSRPALLRITGDLAGLALAGLYVLLAGNGVPARRAFLMLAIWCSARMIEADPPPARVLLLALWVMLASDPLAGLGAGTWLSFAAVAVLIATSGRAACPWPAPWRWLGPHLAIAVGLAPLLADLGEAQSRVGILANLIAIPWVGVVSTPLALLGALAELLYSGAGEFPWWLASLSLAPVMITLSGLAGLDAGGWRPLLADWQAQVAFTVLCLLFLLPRGLPLRLCTLSLLVALLLPREFRPLPKGAFELEVFDVGQGTALAVRTARHLLVYDTGPPLGTQLDPGRDIIAARLRAEGRRRVDRLLLSHGDADHVTGTAGLLAALPVAGLDTSVPVRFGTLRPPPAPCLAGALWHWDEVEFRILHPPGGRHFKGNDASCVLRVSGRWGRLLLPGDIESGAEYRLLRQARGQLAADVVVLPHHGSRTSSNPSFARATGARIVISTTGHQNRYGHPAPRVVARWQRLGATHFDTARDGALRVSVGPGGIQMRAERRDAPRWWRGERAAGP